MSRITPRPENQAADQATNDHDPEPLRDLLTVPQAAVFLHVSDSSVRSYIREGQLKAVRIAGMRSVRIERSELLKLLQPAR